jgi:ABC-type uncharacterized transport system permease subunit
MNAFAIAAMFGYSCAFYGSIRKLKHEHLMNPNIWVGLSVFAVMMHAVCLWLVMVTPDGQNFSITNVISLVNLCISALITLSIFNFKSLSIAPAVYLCSVASVAILSLLPTQSMKYLELSPELLAHVALSVIAYSILMISVLYALQLQVSKYLLKQKKSILRSWLPPLVTIEKQVINLVGFGALLLSLSLLTGFLFLEHFIGGGMGHKTILSLSAWAVYMAMLWQHFKYGCTPRMAVVYTLAGASLLTLAYFGARIVKELVLS